MCSQDRKDPGHDPAGLMPRVISAAWAVLATRAPHGPKAEQATTSSEQDPEDHDD